jgi:anaerobic ribonucleoside-triphosphate reductase
MLTSTGNVSRYIRKSAKYIYKSKHLPYTVYNLECRLVNNCQFKYTFVFACEKFDY